MSASWVAAAVRARGLMDRRLGPDRTRELGAEPSLDEAVASLADSAYGRYVHRGMALGDAERAVDRHLHERDLTVPVGDVLEHFPFSLVGSVFRVEQHHERSPLSHSQVRQP